MVEGNRGNNHNNNNYSNLHEYVTTCGCINIHIYIYICEHKSIHIYIWTYMCIYQILLGSDSAIYWSASYREAKSKGTVRGQDNQWPRAISFSSEVCEMKLMRRIHKRRNCASQHFSQCICWNSSPWQDERHKHRIHTQRIFWKSRFCQVLALFCRTFQVSQCNNKYSDSKSGKSDGYFLIFLVCRMLLHFRSKTRLVLQEQLAQEQLSSRSWNMDIHRVNYEYTYDLNKHIQFTEF